MKKRTEGELGQNQKNFNSKRWIRVICAALCVLTVTTVCLGGSAFASNDKIAALKTDLDGANERIETLKSENKAATSEIDVLQSRLSLTDEGLNKLTAELAAVKEALAQSKEKEASLENRLAALENSNQAAQDEIDRLKTDVETAKEELAALKEQLEELQKEPADKIRIYIDQGHNPTSYHNSGAFGNGLYEQDVTFLVGCILAELLRSDRRFEVQVSRPNKSVVLGTDNESSRMARVAGAAAFEADYFISLHTNSYGDASVNGIEIYVADKAGEAYVFGESLLNGLIGSTNLGNRGMKFNPDFDLIKYSTMPTVLVEMGFISNSTDAALMSEQPELFAQGIYKGILDYFGFLSRNDGVKS